MTTARICLGCKQPVVADRVRHSPGCKVKLEIEEQREAKLLLETILNNKEAYGLFLTTSIAKHLIKLHQLAMRGSHRSAQQFREGALDILELLNAEGEKRDGAKAGIPRKQPQHKQGSAGGRAEAAIQQLDGAPVGVDSGDGRDGAPDRVDEGRGGPGQPDKAVP